MLNSSFQYLLFLHRLFRKKSVMRLKSATRAGKSPIGWPRPGKIITSVGYFPFWISSLNTSEVFAKWTLSSPVPSERHLIRRHCQVDGLIVDEFL